jgi:hypothetical protein
MENWRSYKEELILEEKILNELAQLERIDEVDLKKLKYIAKKTGVSLAKVMLMFKLFAPGAAVAGDDFSSMFDSSLASSSQEKAANADHVKTEKASVALAKSIGSKLKRGDDQTLNIVFSIGSSAVDSHNLSADTFNKSFPQDISKELQTKGYKVGKVQQQDNAISKVVEGNTITIELSGAPSSTALDYSTAGALQIDYAKLTI